MRQSAAGQIQIEICHLIFQTLWVIRAACRVDRVCQPPLRIDSVEYIAFLDAAGLEILLAKFSRCRSHASPCRFCLCSKTISSRCGACGQPPTCGRAVGNAPRFPRAVLRMAHRAKAGIGSADCPQLHSALTAWQAAPPIGSYTCGAAAILNRAHSEQQVSTRHVALQAAHRDPMTTARRTRAAADAPWARRAPVGQPSDIPTRFGSPRALCLDRAQ
ncbi:hypothetical protein AZOA_39780 [Azoarcus sp. Aa7]|nr:hypothetical protein [Azoarcus sp. Aa7]